MKLFYWSESQKIALPVSLAIILIFCFVYRHFTKNKSELVRELPVKILSVVLIIMEIIKITISLRENNILNALPFHFCSMYLFWFPLATFSKGKFKHAMQAVSVLGAMFMIILIYITPMSIIDKSSDNILLNYGTFHNFAFHQLIIFYFFFNVINKIYVPKKTDFLCMMLATIVYGAVAIPGAIITQYNYCNILYFNIPFLDNITLKYGHAVYLIVYMLGALILVGSLTYLYYLVYKLCYKLKYKKNYIN